MIILLCDSLYTYSEFKKNDKIISYIVGLLRVYNSSKKNGLDSFEAGWTTLIRD